MILFNVHVIHLRMFYEFVYMSPVTVTGGAVCKGATPSVEQ